MLLQKLNQETGCCSIVFLVYRLYKIFRVCNVISLIFKSVNLDISKCMDMSAVATAIVEKRTGVVFFSRNPQWRVWLYRLPD